MKNYILISMALLLTTKLMIFSTSGIAQYCIALSNVINVLIILFNHKRLKNIYGFKLLSVIFIFISLVIINIAKINTGISIKDVLYPTDIQLLLTIIAIFVCKRETLIKGLQLYLNIFSIILFIGIILYLMNYLGLIRPISLVVAPDHASTFGYENLYYLAYYPSWIQLPFGFKRFTSIFWEPGTLGIYLIFFICAEKCLIKTKLSTYRVIIFVTSGFLSFSMLFLMFSFVIFVCLKKNKIKKIILFLLLMISLYLGYSYFYDLILYRFSYDPTRGFVGNNRSGTLDYYINVINQSDLINVLFGFGPYQEFFADSTSIIIKFYQRGIIGSIFLLLSYSILIVKSKCKIDLIVMVLSFLVLSQIEGALSSIYFIIAALNLSYIYDKNVLVVHR